MTAPPECPTCKPRWAQSPSGGAWFHRRPCHGGTQVRPYAVARAAHPAKGTRRPLRSVPMNNAMRTWLKHVPGCQCSECEYAEAHMDDDDDLGEAG
jgi:hypothetical protein